VGQGAEVWVREALLGLGDARRTGGPPGESMFKTGQFCRSTGQYVFSSYVDAPAGTVQPTSEERVIPMRAGGTFPPIRSTGQAAYWNKLR
jgi:hypothetical protein